MPPICRSGTNRTENKSHKEKKAQSMGSPQGSAAAWLKTILQIKVAAKIPEHSDKQDPPTTTTTETVPSASSKPPMPCKGMGWETTDGSQPWQDLFGTYMFYVEGAAKASTKFTIERANKAFSAKSSDCTHRSQNGSQHGNKCCKPCHLLRCDHDKVARTAIQGMDKLIHASELLGQNCLSKSENNFTALCYSEVRGIWQPSFCAIQGGCQTPCASRCMFQKVASAI